jgi:hypothetical protein
MSRNFTSASSQWASVTASSAPIPGYPFTLMAWFQAVTPVTADMVIMSLNTDPSFAGMMGLFVGLVDGKFSSIVNDQGGNTYSFQPVGSALVANTWYCGVFSGDVGVPRTTYLGSPSGVASITDNRASTPGTNKTNIYVGAFSSSTDFYNGLIGEVACWNAVLSDGEVRALCAGVRPYRIRRGNLKIYYPMWGLGSPEPDYSGLGNNITLHASPPLANNPPTTLWTPKRSSFIPAVGVTPPPPIGNSRGMFVIP